MSFNRNPNGKNQYPHDEEKEKRLCAALHSYHSDGLSSYPLIAKLLAKEHGIIMSGKTVQRRLDVLGLYAAKKTMKTLSLAEAEQLVVTEMDKDVAKRLGVRTVRAKVTKNAGVILPRQNSALVSDIMHAHDAAAFDGREPTAKKIFRVPKHPLGIHQRWAGDGHDKLYKIGFPVWAMVDDATAKLLGGWVCPSNRLAVLVVYMFLCLVEKYGGMPIQVTTDCGAETTDLFAVVTALRALYHPEYDADEVPAHVYLRSIHNISIERSWYRLRLDFGDNAVLKFQEGIIEGWYKPHDVDQFALCQFLWSRILQAELDAAIAFRNMAPMRLQTDKPGPSGKNAPSRNVAFSLYEDWGGKDCLLPIPREAVQKMKADLGGDQLLEFNDDAEFVMRAKKVLESLQPVAMTLDNAWVLFRVMLPLVFPERDDFRNVQL
ncbi:hypothetical protein B0H11DRAFT_1713461 [Mycena galericulata]|nr:hypothetical protein B0H11DRAFT_1713461 [Mycena galericulata]